MTPEAIKHFLAVLQWELDGEVGARDSYAPTTPGYEYHDGRSDGLRWALEYFTGSNP